MPTVAEEKLDRQEPGSRAEEAALAVEEGLRILVEYCTRTGANSLAHVRALRADVLAMRCHPEAEVLAEMYRFMARLDEYFE